MLTAAIRCKRLLWYARIVAVRKDQKLLCFLGPGFSRLEETAM